MNTRRPPARSPRRPPAHDAGLSRWVPVGAALSVLAVVVFAGFSGGAEVTSETTAPLANPGAVDDATLTIPSSTLPGLVIAPEAGVVKTNLSQPLRRGSTGAEVTAMQQRLKELGFDPGPIDGIFGGGTEQAVWAFEALVLRTPWNQKTGVLTNDLWQTMQDRLLFQPRRPQPSGARHMEIYLDLQTAIVFDDNRAVLLTHISSGELDEKGEPKLWCELVTYNTDKYGEPLPEPVTKDECAYAKTPGGVFKFYRRYDGNRLGPLGGMWNPVYFNYGIAVHGAQSVPIHPASHGCVRIPMWIADYFPSLVANGDLVYVWDGRKEPEQQSKDDMLPSFNFRNPNSTSTTSSSSTSTTSTVPTTTTKPPSTTTTTKPPSTTTSSSVPPTTLAASP